MMTLYVPHRHRRMMRRLAGDRLMRHAEIFSDVHVPVDVKDEKDAFVVYATLPGLEADDLNIEIIDNILEISGEFNRESEEENESYLRRERVAGSFRRRLRFPAKLEAAKAEASLSNGILTLRLPKVEEQRPKAIKVKTK